MIACKRRWALSKDFSRIGDGDLLNPTAVTHIEETVCIALAPDMLDGTDVSSVWLRDSSALVLRGFELDLACPGEYENDSPVMWPHKLTLAIDNCTPQVETVRWKTVGRLACVLKIYLDGLVKFVPRHSTANMV
jgi:hypothetical protein